MQTTPAISLSDDALSARIERQYNAYLKLANGKTYTAPAERRHMQNLHRRVAEDRAEMRRRAAMKVAAQ